MLREIKDWLTLPRISHEELDSIKNELWNAHAYGSFGNSAVMDSFQSSDLGYGTGNDKAEMFSAYSQSRVPRWQLDSFYRSSGLIRKIVDLPVNDATRRGIKILHDESELIKMQLEALQIPQKSKRAAKYGRLFRLGVVFLDIDDGRMLHEPVDLKNIRTINSATVYDYDWIRPYMFDWADTIEPTYYSLTRSMGESTIHKDRLLIFNGFDAGINNWVGTNGTGESIVDAIYRPFRNLDVDYNAASTMAKDFRVMIVKMLGFGQKAKGQNRDSVAAAKARYRTMKEMGSIVNGYVMGNEDNIEYLTTKVEGYPELVRLAKDYLCMVSGIPHTKLFNEGTGAGLNNGKGESEANDWIDVVEDFQEDFFRPNYNKILLYLAAYNGFEPFRFEFNPIAPRSEKEQSEIDKNRAQTEYLQARTDAQRLKDDIVTRKEIRVNRLINNQGDDAGRFTVEGEDPPEPEKQNPVLTQALKDSGAIYVAGL